MVTNQADSERSDASARLERGAAVLLVAFWVVHLVVMLVRAELNHHPGRETFLDSFIRRGSFALFGALLGYGLYRALRVLRHRDFIQQMGIGAGLAFVVACIQGAANAVVFNNEDYRLLASFLYASMYWFWFYFCWTTAYLAFAYSLEVQEQERRSARLVVEAQEAQVLALRYQVNPHFLFNTLNAIAALIRDVPSRAEAMVVQLSDFFRRTLAINPLEDVTLAEEVELQRLYLEIERTRFPDRLRVEVSIDGDSLDALVPALLLQPLVENSVKHGVARSEGGCLIRILGRIEGGTLSIIVEDDAAVSGNSRVGEQVGLRNVRERLRSRFGNAAILETERIAGGGFRNALRMPVQR